MKLRIGLIGLGGIARQHIKNLKDHELGQITAVCDIVPDAARATAQELDAHPYTDFNEMLDKEPLDVLFVCVPPFAHGDIEEKAAARGIHLLVEKPQGLSMDVVRRKAAVIREANIMCAVGYCLRYTEAAESVKQYLAGKDIAIIRAQRFGALPPTPWFRVMSKSGGQLVEQTTHNVDMLRDLAGSNVTKVYADMALRVMGDVPGLDIPEVSAVSMTFESGVIAQLATGFVMPSGSDIEILGRDFRIAMDGFQSVTYQERNPETNQKETRTETFKTNFSKRQDDAFLQAVASGDRSRIRSTYDDALHTLHITLAANESAQSGVPVWLNA